MVDLNDLPPVRAMPRDRMTARQHGIEMYAKAPTASRVRSRITVRLAAVAIGASAALVGTTALAYVAFKPATVPVADQTRCYTKASLEGGNDDFYGTTVGQAMPADGTRKAVAAVEVCSALWRQGLLTPGSKRITVPERDSADQPVPRLTACVLEKGIAAVIPGDDNICARLGLPRLVE